MAVEGRDALRTMQLFWEATKKEIAAKSGNPKRN